VDLYGSDTLPFLRCSKIEPNRLQPLKVDPARAMRHLDRRPYLRHEYAKEKAEAWKLLGEHIEALSLPVDGGWRAATIEVAL